MASSNNTTTGVPDANLRTIDGSNNNLNNSALNEAGTDFTRVGPANFADGISTMQAGPDPRTISNVVVGQGDPNTADPGGLSGMMYAWGQFIDHDLDLEQAGTNTADISVTVQPGDPSLPAGTTIPLTRVATDPNTGAGKNTPATAINSITGWLDASMVYGSDPATAASLRTADGHMLTSAGNNLPIVNGPNGLAYAAGDTRAQENPDLTALQTLFVREHNYWVDHLSAQHPDWSGDQLYNQARAIVTAEIANITYTEFLPHLLGPNAIAPYTGYNPHVDPRISEDFEGAAYRFGHSIVSGNIESIDNDGNTTSSQDLTNAFFESPSTFVANGGADGLLRHLGADSANAMDARIIPELRNFLSDPPDATDLASTNIQRGRDLGLPTLNEERVVLGMQPYTDFSQITSDAATAAALRQEYGTVDALDLWTGGLAENHAPGAMVGPTFQAIIANQFERLRDGDRLWFQNQGFDPQTLQQIENTSLSDIIDRDTNTNVMQTDAFVATDRHDGSVAPADPNLPQLVIASKDTPALAGGPQSDEFVFDRGGIQTEISNFNPGQDMLVFIQASAGMASDPVPNIQSKDGNSIVHAGGDTITLIGVDPSQLSSANLLVHKG